MAISKFRIPNIIILAIILLILALLFAWPHVFGRPGAKAKGPTVAAKKPVEQLPDVPPALAARYKSIAAAIDMDRVKASVNTLASYPSRMVGYPGCDQAADYVEQQFRSIGLQDVAVEKFRVTVPVDEGSRLVINGQEIPIHALWPNLVRTSHLPPEGMDVHLIDAARGKLPDFDDKVVRGSAALVDFNSGSEWLNAPRLGARVLLFVEPEDTIRGEGEAKFSAIPVSMPRFWISRQNAARIRGMLAQLGARYASVPPIKRPQLKAKVYCKMLWQKPEARNIVGVIRGSDPVLRNQWIVLHASYDGISVVPALAPGAESTCGISGLFELARLYKQPQFAPKRSIMFVATSAHYQGLLGMRAFIDKHIDSYVFPGTIDNIHAYLNKHWPLAKSDANRGWPPWIVPLVALVIMLVIINSIRARLANVRLRRPWVAVVPVVLLLGALLWTWRLYSSFSAGFDYKIPDPPKFYVWSGLDLSSQTKGVGIFYKGYFYDFREDLQGKFSDLASRTRENSERIASTLGFYEQRTARFADGVNPIQGKNWRNFVPGKFALDSEVVTLAGGKGVSLVSIEDSRQMVDTPFDTKDKINFGNLADQLVMIACLTDHWTRDTNDPLDEQVITAQAIDRRTVRVADPLRVGFIQGVYAGRTASGANYYKPRTDKDMLPASRLIKLSEPLPVGTKTVAILHKPLTKLGIPRDEPCKFTRMGLQGGFARLTGNVVQYDPKKSFVPDLKIGDCLAVVRSPHKSFMGVRANIVDKTTPKEGFFSIPGVAPITAYGWQRMTSLGAYKLDPVRGDIISAPDQGSYGQFYPTEFAITTGHKDMPVIVFDCKATSIYDLIDPQSLRALGGLSIYEGDTNGAPKQFGSAVAVPEPMNPHVEDMAVIFTEDTKKSRLLAVGSQREFRRIRIKIVMSAGPAANRLLLLNSTLGDEVIKGRIVQSDGRSITVDDPIQCFVQGVYTDRACKGTNYLEGKFGAAYTDAGLLQGKIKLTRPLPPGTETVYIKPDARPEGIGYDFTEGGILDETAYKVARDMWTIDEFRLRTLESRGIINEGLRSLHDTGRKFLKLAEQAKGSLNYSVFDSYCRAAWGYEARAYPDITKTAQDVVNGVIFYLFLMLPFAFFCERLFFAFPHLLKQIIAFFAIFGIIFLIFDFVHPAFQIAGNPAVILIAFVMLALSILVIFIVSSKFEDQLKQFNRAVSGIHKADIGRMSVAAAAFSLGISNMRRRKARTILTCVTLVLLTFTVLSFTSIVSVLRFNKVPARKDAETNVYDGIMIRTAMWESMQQIAYRLLKDEFGNEGKRGKVYPVAPRAWFFGTTLGEQSFLTLRKGDLAYDAKAAVGMVPDEAQVMDLDGKDKSGRWAKNRRAFVAGDWFGYRDGVRVPGPVSPHSMIIPDVIAEKLSIKPADVGKAKIEFAGAKYTVIGIIKNDVFKRIKDLDNEPLTPVDYILMSKQSAQQQQSMGEAGFREYTHLEPSNCFIVPFETLMGMGGEVKSIAIKFATYEEVQRQLDALMPRLGLNLYAGVDGSIYRYSSIGSSASKGFSNVFIPVLIAALIVLNTMLGSVYERVREIGIFSSIGLAPNHIAILFIAESMVYANLGAVSGYVIGQTLSKILTSTGWLPGLYLNFSSMSAVSSTVVVVAVVLLSTLYPARKASEVATPAVDRSWKVPEPVGDNWDIVLPFAVTGEQAVGVNSFLKEWFQAYEEYSIGDFVTQDVRSGAEETDYGTAYSISCKAWLAPFDLGVSQIVNLNTVPTSMEDVFEVRLRITRESGDISNWKRVNRRFLNTLRKQFLIWRTLRADERERYLRGAAESVEETTGPQVAPA